MSPSDLARDYEINRAGDLACRKCGDVIREHLHGDASVTLLSLLGRARLHEMICPHLPEEMTE